MGENVKHTPGPWRVEEGTTLIWGDCNPDDTTTYGMGYPIAECRMTPSASWARGPKKYEEAEANARLVSAAPELLEALKGLLSDIEEYQEINKLGGKDNHWQVISRAAIAKAEARP